MISKWGFLPVSSSYKKLEPKKLDILETYSENSILALSFDRS
jgi:hypothetical protein